MGALTTVIVSSSAIAGPLTGNGTSPGQAIIRHAPLASQDRSSFGEAIAFVPAAYTPPGISVALRPALNSQDAQHFGYTIAFVPAGYTPPGTMTPNLNRMVASLADR
jgi:hypothetical protein